MCQITDLAEYRKTNPPAARAMVAGYRIWLTSMEMWMATWVGFGVAVRRGMILPHEKR